MTDPDKAIDALGGFLRRANARMRTAAGALKDEYRKGTEGDDSPVQPIAPNAIDIIKNWLAADDDAAEPADGTAGEATPDGPDADADEVADLLGRVDWQKVSGTVRDTAAAQRMRDLADRVDWAAARPVAARVAAALIAAAAAGELGVVQGATGRYVARTIANEAGLADRVAQRIRGNHSAQTKPLVAYIDTTATEASGHGFEATVAELGRLGSGD